MAHSEEVQRILDAMAKASDEARLGLKPGEHEAKMKTATLVCAFDDSPAAELVSSRHTHCAACGAGIMYRPQNEAAARKICMPCAIREGTL